jgi:hypothetical protein
MVWLVVYVAGNRKNFVKSISIKNIFSREIFMHVQRCVWGLTLLMLLGTLCGAQIIDNGDFESGIFNPWTISSTGSMQVVSSYEGITPHSGNSFALINSCFDTNWAFQDLGGPQKGTLTGYIYLPVIDYIQAIKVTSSDGHVAFIATNLWASGKVCYMKDGWEDSGQTAIALTTGVWHEIKIIAEDGGMSAYWDGQPVFEKWVLAQDIQTIEFGSSWNTAPAGWDDFSFTPTIFPPGLNNGDFETGGLRPWNRDAESDTQIVSEFNGMIPRTGNYLAVTHTNYNNNWVSQDLQIPKSGTLVGYLFMPTIEGVPSVIVQSSDGHRAIIMGNQWASGKVCYMKDNWGDSGQTDIALTPGIWQEIKFVVDHRGLHVYWDNQLVTEWYMFRDIKAVFFGSAWGTAPAGWDDFSFVPYTSTPMSKIPFYIGWYDHRMRQSVAEYEYFYQEQKNQGMNSILLWGSNWNSEIQLTGYALDAVQNLDMRMIVQVNTFAMMGSNGYPVSVIDEQIKWFKDYPALAGWYLFDEPEKRTPALTPEWMKERYAQVKGIDSLHPMWVVHSGVSNAVPYLNAEPTAYTDGLMSDTYPVVAGSAEFANPMWNVAKDTRLGVQLSGDHNKIELYFQVVQACGVNGEFGKRLPTFAEERYLSYAPVVEGARGLFYWDYWDANGLPVMERDEFRNNVVAPIAREINQLIPAIISNSSRVTISSTRDTDSAGHGIEDVTYLYGEDDTGGYLIAVNHTAVSIPVTFNLQGSVLSSRGSSAVNIPVQFESREVVMTPSGSNRWQLSDTFGPFDVNVYFLHLPVAVTVIPGDANKDGYVDVGDLGILAANYGSSGKNWAQGDFNGDTLVDVGDLGILAAHYGEGTNRAMDFQADYTKAFGTTGTDDVEHDTDGSLCSALGLPLITSLLLIAMVLVKLEE